VNTGNNKNTKECISEKNIESAEVKMDRENMVEIDNDKVDEWKFIGI